MNIREFAINLPDLEWIELDDDQLVYYNRDKKPHEKDICFYISSTGAADGWQTAMLEIIECPYCRVTVGVFENQDLPDSKKWMGYHLAHKHRIAVETYLLNQEQKQEYAVNGKL